MVIDRNPKVSNSQLRLTITAMQQVIGENNSQEILQDLNLEIDTKNLPPDNSEKVLSAQVLANLLSEIDRTYADRGSRILTRIGRAIFHQVLREEPTWMSTARRTMSIWKPSRGLSVPCAMTPASPCATSHWSP